MPKLRSSGVPNNGQATVDDSYSVELEKSNILVIGPTGSGIYNFLIKSLLGFELGSILLLVTNACIHE